METKQLASSVDINSRGVTPSGMHTATHLRVRSLDIHIEDIGVGTCDVQYELGTIVSGNFEELQVEQPNGIGTFNLDTDTFGLLANTPISPSEKGKTVYDVIKDRIYDYLKSQSIITEG